MEKVLVMDFETKNHLELTSSHSTSAKAESLWSFMDRLSKCNGFQTFESGGSKCH